MNELIPLHSADSKYVDTRTFTRPKKKSFTNCDVNSTFATYEHPELPQQQQKPQQQPYHQFNHDHNQTPSINLKIGGLVTSGMQRSFLGDVSPPASVLMESMGNSLITSNDFTNINEFINSEEDGLTSAQFQQYRLSDAIKDRNFLERLTNYDDSLFAKDADIEKFDVNPLIGSSYSGNSTLQNSTDSSGTSNIGGKNDETFVGLADGNATFNAGSVLPGGDSNRTFVQGEVPDQNHTFNLADATFNAAVENINTNATLPSTAALNDETVDLLVNEQMAFNENFGVETTFLTSARNATIDLSKGMSLGLLNDSDLEDDLFGEDFSPAKGFPRDSDGEWLLRFSLKYLAHFQFSLRSLSIDTIAAPSILGSNGGAT